MEVRFGSLLFTSKFDSGNLARVEKVPRPDDEPEGGSYFSGLEARPDYEFNVWTKPDCADTPYENGNRSWFYFGVRGGSAGKLLKVTIQNLNRQGKLYSQGHTPLVKTLPSKPQWERMRDKPTYEAIDGNFLLSFTYRFTEGRGSTTYFAFCYPWSYTECQERLAELDSQFSACLSFTPTSHADAIYYHREVLCHSLDKNNVDLITISDCSNMCDNMEPRFDSKLFPDTDMPRCRAFKNKRVYLVSSRVHPGETPASCVFSGFLDFILREDDPRAKQLRRQFVFKMIPILNPDGVVRGHYRTDSRGVNLNRMYLDPDFELYPSIYAAKSVLVYHHVHNRVVVAADQSKHRNPTVPEQKSGASQGHKKATNQKLRVTASSPVVTPLPLDPVTPVPLDGRSQSAGNKTYRVVYDGDARSKELSTSLDRETSSAGKRCSFHGHMRVSTTGAIDVEPQLIDSVTDSVADSVRKMSLDSQLSYSGYANDSAPYAIRSSYEVASGGECQDDDDNDDHNTEHLGNEGSEDDDDDGDGGGMGSGTTCHAPHLSDSKLRQIPPNESGIAFYVDLHGHASKRGCFIYGNYFEDEDTQVENMLFPKLASLNSAHFDFTGCNFTERNMYSKDKREGLSKEGAGRVAIHKALGIIHSYTLECNYNTGRIVNSVPPAYRDNGRASPPPLAGFPPKYTQQHYAEVGRALAVVALDMSETNPWSRLTMSEHSTIHGVRDWVRRFLRGLRGLPKGMPNKPQRAAHKASSAGNTGGSPASSGPSSTTIGGVLVPRVAFLSSRHNANNSNQNEAVGGRGVARRLSQPGPSRRDLGPVREPHKTLDRTRHRTSSSSATVTMTTSSSSLATGGASSAPPTATSAPPLHQPASVPVTLTLTTATTMDLKTLAPKTPPSYPRPFLPQTAPPSDCLEEQPGVSKCTPGSPYSLKSVSLQSPFSVRGIMSPPSSSACKLQPGMAGKRPLTDSSTSKKSRRAPPAEDPFPDIEEEKVQQLKNMPSYPVQHRPGNARNPKPLEPPKSDPLKRRNKKPGPGKRRSNSYSPKASKLASRRAAGSGTDSDVEKKVKSHRRRSLGKLRAPKGNSAEAYLEQDESEQVLDQPPVLPATISPSHPVATELDPPQFQVLQVNQPSLPPGKPSNRKKRWKVRNLKSTQETSVKGKISGDLEPQVIDLETTQETTQDLRELSTGGATTSSASLSVRGKTNLTYWVDF